MFNQMVVGKKIKNKRLNKKQEEKWYNILGQKMKRVDWWSSNQDMGLE